MTSHELQIWLEERLNRIEEHQTDIKVTLAKQAKDVEYHIKRTNLLEARVEQVADEMKKSVVAVAADLKPVKEHVTKLKGVLQAAGVVGLLLGIVASWMKIFG